MAPRFFVLIMGLIGGLSGCATPSDPLGADIREALGVTKTSADETKDSVELNYDPKVILKRAEALYQRGDYIEAGGEYQHFLDLHPLHEWADYALLKLGMTHFRQFATIDRDPEPVRKALATFRKLLANYPNTKYGEEARKRVADSEEWLAEHEFYVGRFYYKKKAYPAAIYRFRQILTGYPDYAVVADTLYYLALSYEGTGEMDQATARLRDLIERYPESTYHKRALRVLARLNGQPAL